ncbi:M56 family metallopeptidase [Acaricomes phytoseiuli]|uniref:M56 family metallopeptidase n=1 Tax=Acaricomes phytoseiuli TaxID=291968 RepID=UPI00037A53E9|nr:M56 family metallopeptidase [Acaricomes phytoseiuli]
MSTDTLTLSSWILAVLAVILAWPAPTLLSRAKWPRRSPATAMILWQAIGLAGGLSMISAMLIWGLAPLGPNVISAVMALIDMTTGSGDVSGLSFWHIFALSAALLLGAHLLFTLLLTYVRIGRQRRRHRQLLRLLSSPAAEPGTVVIDHAAPVAYCLPGGARSVMVLSAGLLDLLQEEELAAVLSHERSHLNQRHHLLLWAFAAWKSALPWLPTSKLAQRSVSELIEMLADDAALQSVSEPTLARSIIMVASGAADPRNPGGQQVPETTVPGSIQVATKDLERTTAARVERLINPQPPLPALARATILTLSSALLIIAPAALLIIPAL